MPLNQPVPSGPGAGRAVTYGSSSSAELKLAGEKSGGDGAAVEWRLLGGDEAPRNTYTQEDETVYVLEGAITACVGDQPIDVEAGSYAALPTNAPHGLTVRGGQARLLTTPEPSGAEYFLVPAMTPTPTASGSSFTNARRWCETAAAGHHLPARCICP
jgi:quercetin dioxygenase-like cupin family protein